jgi:hypothetical protein
MNLVAESEITREDYQAFVQFIRRRAFRSSGGWFWLIIVTVPFAIVGGMVAAGWDGQSGSGPMPWILGFVFGVAWLYVAAILNAALMRKRLQPTEDGFMLGWQHWEILPDDLHTRSKHHEARFDWSIVAPPVEEKEHWFVMVERTSAVIIPKRSFQSGEEQKAFIESIRSLAQHGPY